MADETATLAAYVANLKFEDIPHEVKARAKALTLDFLGSAIRARRDAESTPSLLKMLEALALDGKGESTVFGDAKTWTPAVAALLNGALGHSLDFDDTHADSSLHASAPVVPAAFAVGELVGASGRDVLTAIVAGYEVCCRLGNALDPTSHYARGFHPTATAGTYGAAAAASKLFGLSKEQIVAAFGVSGSQAAGSLQFLVNGAWNKRYQVGAAAMNGVIAATLARNDFVGATESIEGKHGLSGRLQRQRPSRQGSRGPRQDLRDHEDRREALSELPLHPCRARRADRDAAGAQSDAGPDQARRDRAAPQRHHADGRRRHQAASDLDRRRPVLDVLHRRGGARPGPFRLGRLRPARRCRGRCARRQVRRGAGRPPRDRPQPSLRRARQHHHRRRRARAALSRSLRRAEFVSRTRRRWRRNS